MNAGSDWPSSRALLTLKPSRMRWTLNSTWTLQQTARNCAGQFSILSPGEKCQGKKGVVNLSAPDKMPIEIKKEIQLEIAHVLFIDVVGYSKLSINDQHAAVEELNRIVRASEKFQGAEAANRLIRIPTGDGMVLVFYTNPEAPVQCAVEISRALREHPGLQLRMGIHSGPVSGVVDVNERANLTGAGINFAKRVMDCGDVGHILVSKHVAEDLEEYERWRPLLHDLGTCEVKHGLRVGIASLYDNQFGNSQLPKKLQAVKRHRTHVRWAGVAIPIHLLG